MIDELTTVLVTTSPSPRHPDTRIIEDTINSVRWHLPEAQILILCDAVRPEQEHCRESYSEYVLRLGELCANKWKNVRTLPYPEFLHQAWCVARALPDVRTSLILITEHDQQLLPIKNPWNEMARMILEQRVNLIRFMLGDEMRPEWQQFMLGPVELNGFQTVLLKTVQWSQRTHLASTDYYRKMLAEHLKPTDRCYIEDRLYGQCDDWEANKLTIFAPPDLPQRIVHTDARNGEPKFDSILEGK